MPDDARTAPLVLSLLPDVRLYLLPGLGADPRMYRNLDCGPDAEVIALPWISPGSAADLGAYAEKLIEHYRPEPPCFIGGVSLGGMIAQEWAHRAEVEGLVLISTAVDRAEMAAPIRAAAALRAGPVISKPLLQALGTAGDRFTSKSPEGRALFLEMLRESDAEFMTFGARAVLDWEPPGIAAPYLRIHGTADRVFPASSVRDAVMIRGGNHFMIFDRGAEIGKEIGRFLAGSSKNFRRL